jgi:hypothetical protein
MPRRLIVAVLLFLCGGGCNVSKPKGVLGLRWGEPAAEAAAKIGVACETWEPWAGGQGFEVCRSAGPPIPAFGAPAEVELIRKDGRLEGVELWFRDPGTPVQQAIVREFDLEDPGGEEPYQTWSSGEAVRYTREGPGGSRLVVAGPSFGKVFAAYLLSRGMGKLEGGLRH